MTNDKGRMRLLDSFNRRGTEEKSSIRATARPARKKRPDGFWKPVIVYLTAQVQNPGSAAAGWLWVLVAANSFACYGAIATRTDLATAVPLPREAGDYS